MSRVQDGVERATGLYRCTQCSFGFSDLSLYPATTCRHESLFVSEHKAACADRTISVVVCRVCGECLSSGAPG